MNPLAQELNDQLTQHSPHVLEMLSDLGKNLFFPKGILTQSAEAKDKAFKFNATIGIATEKGGPMYLQCIQDKLSGFDPKDIFPYAPPAGKPELRALWREKMLRENPSQQGKHFSNPIVTNALTNPKQYEDRYVAIFGGGIVNDRGTVVLNGSSSVTGPAAASCARAPSAPTSSRCSRPASSPRSRPGSPSSSSPTPTGLAYCAGPSVSTAAPAHS